MRSIRTTVAAAALILAGLATGQTGGITKIDGLVAWVSDTPSRIDVFTGCFKPKTCSSSLAKATTSYAGGTAYDARHQAAWASEGSTVSLVSLFKCNELCNFTHTPATKNGVVTGLAMHEPTQTLWVLDAVAGEFGLTSYDVSGVPTTCATKVKQCTIKDFGVKDGKVSTITRKRVNLIIPRRFPCTPSESGYLPARKS